MAMDEMTSEAVRELTRAQVATTVDFGVTEFALSWMDLEELSRTFGRTVMRMMMPKIGDRRVRERMERFIDGE